MIDNIKIVDGHVHTFSSDELASKIITSFNKIYDIQFINPGNGTINNVLGNMRESNIDYTIMANFAPPKVIHSNNLWAIDTSKEYHNLIALVSFHPDMDEENIGKLLEYYVKQGAKGMKIHPMAQGFMPDHPRLKAAYEYCNEVALPIEFHCGRVSNARLNEYADLQMILPLIERYENIPFILTHMADGNVDDVIRLSRDYKNVLFDTSIVITGYPSIRGVNEPSWLDDAEVVDIIQRIGAERVMFGSDYPWGSPRHDIDRIMHMDLSRQQKEMIFSGNAMRVFDIGA